MEYDDYNPSDELEESIENCGMYEANNNTYQCHSIGTEHCGFRCIWRDLIDQEVIEGVVVEPNSNDADEIPF